MCPAISTSNHTKVDDIDDKGLVFFFQTHMSLYVTYNFSNSTFQHKKEEKNYTNVTKKKRKKNNE